MRAKQFFAAEEMEISLQYSNAIISSLHQHQWWRRRRRLLCCGIRSRDYCWL